MPVEDPFSEVRPMDWRSPWGCLAGRQRRGSWIPIPSNPDRAVPKSWPCSGWPKAPMGRPQPEVAFRAWKTQRHVGDFL